MTQALTTRPRAIHYALQPEARPKPEPIAGNKLLFVDLDEVFTDFIGGYLRLIEKDWEWFKSVHPIGQWDIAKGLGITHVQFWQTITSAGTGFWLGLQPKPWAIELRNLLNKHCGARWYLLTSPGQSLYAYEGKVLWIRRFFGQTFDRFFITNHKHLLASPERTLMDDCEANILKFSEWGGQGFLFPAVVNCLHRDSDNPLQFTLTEKILGAVN